MSAEVGCARDVPRIFESDGPQKIRPVGRGAVTLDHQPSGSSTGTTLTATCTLLCSGALELELELELELGSTRRSVADGGGGGGDDDGGGGGGGGAGGRRRGGRGAVACFLINKK